MPHGEFTTTGIEWKSLNIPFLNSIKVPNYWGKFWYFVGIHLSSQMLFGFSKFEDLHFIAAKLRNIFCSVASKNRLILITLIQINPIFFVPMFDFFSNEQILKQFKFIRKNILSSFISELNKNKSVKLNRGVPATSLFWRALKFECQHK